MDNYNIKKVYHKPKKVKGEKELAHTYIRKMKKGKADYKESLIY